MDKIEKIERLIAPAMKTAVDLGLLPGGLVDEETYTRHWTAMEVILDQARAPLIAELAHLKSVSLPNAAEETQAVLHVGTDRYGRTWRVLDRDDRFSVYYTKPDSPAHHVIYDSLDDWNDPPRVLLGRAQEAERKANTLEREMASLMAERDRLRAVAKEYHDVATFSSWDSGECRKCMYDLENHRHQPVCEYWQAEQALLSMLREGGV